MAQKKRKQKKNTKSILILGLVGAVTALAFAFFISKRINTPANNIQNETPASNATYLANQDGSIELPPITKNEYSATPIPDEMRAMWISFLEWQKMDISSEQAMRDNIAPIFDNCTNMGLNTVIVAVRPFGDALYPSQTFPWSSLITGTQGQDPGYDPLQVLVEEAHVRNLRIEAWLNPYRIKNPASGIEQLSPNNPAILHPEWTKEVDGSLWYDPGLPQVQQLVSLGVQEIVENYQVDGIHLDDYFYPEFSAEQKGAGNDTAFDAATFAEYGSGKVLADWRRENVNTLVSQLYKISKEVNPTVSFGISPQGNNENNYTMQYSDVALWMATPGYVDYVMPQLYWGFDYRTANGRDSYAFANVSQEWASYPRTESVRLFAGLGAYRIGVGDGGANEQDEWKSGHNIADMVEHLRQVDGFTGFALFRYDFFFASEEPEAILEKEALSTLLQ